MKNKIFQLILSFLFVSILSVLQPQKALADFSINITNGGPFTYNFTYTSPNGNYRWPINVTLFAVSGNPHAVIVHYSAKVNDSSDALEIICGDSKNSFEVGQSPISPQNEAGNIFLDYSSATKHITPNLTLSMECDIYDSNSTTVYGSFPAGSIQFAAGGTSGTPIIVPSPTPIWHNENLPHALLYGYREIYTIKDSHCMSSTDGKPQICSTTLPAKNYFNTYQSDTYPATGQFTPQTVCMDPSQGKDKYHVKGKTPGVIVDFTPIKDAKQYNIIYWINDSASPKFHELLIPAARDGHQVDWVYLPDAYGEDVAFTKGATVGMKIAVWDGDTFNGYSDIVRFTNPTCTKPFPSPTITVIPTTVTVSPTCVPRPPCLDSGFEKCQIALPIERYCPPPSPTTQAICPKPDAPQSFVIGSTGASQFIAGSWMIANPMADATYSLVYQAQTNGKAGILPGFKNGNTYQAFTTLPTTNALCGQVNANVEYTSSSCGTVDGPSISTAGPACQ